MTFAISAIALIEAIALIYFGLVILEIRDEMNHVYPELMKIIGEQNKALQGNLDALNRWSDLSADIVSHIERVEDMEGDIKDIFEWIHSVDNNVADMRRDIQDTETKLGYLMAVYDKNAQMFFEDLQSLQKDINESKEKLDKIDKVTGRYKDTNTNLLQDLIDINKIYGKSNVQTTTYGFEPDDQKGEDKDDVNGDE